MDADEVEVDWEGGVGEGEGGGRGWQEDRGDVGREGNGS
jgi:hypothetical protein